MEEGEGTPVEGKKTPPPKRDIVPLSEATKGFGIFEDLNIKLQGTSFSDETKKRVRRGVEEYIREFSPEDVGGKLVEEWRKASVPGEREKERRKARLLVEEEIELTPDDVKEVRKMLGALQISLIALTGGKPEKFNQKIAGRLVEKFQGRAIDERAREDGGAVQVFEKAAEDYRDLRGILIKETGYQEVRPEEPEEKQGEVQEKIKLSPLPTLEIPKTPIFKEFKDNLNRLRDYVQKHYGEAPELAGMMGGPREEYNRGLKRLRLPEDTLIFYDPKEDVSGKPIAWVVSSELSNESLTSKPDYPERVVRDLMRSAKPKDPNFTPDKVEFEKP